MKLSLTRCNWVENLDDIMKKYHDEEWGKEIHDDHQLFEILILESFQAGLSFSCILKKRENFRRAFDCFNIDKIIKYDKNKIEELMNDRGIVRNKLKIIATINNAKVFKEIQKEFLSFNNYLYQFTKNKVIYEEYQFQTSSSLSDQISKDLVKRGMKFVGSTIIYSYLQAIGLIFPHSKNCFCYQKNRRKL